jgi:hypothetical protein
MVIVVVLARNGPGAGLARVLVVYVIRKVVVKDSLEIVI